MLINVLSIAINLLGVVLAFFFFWRRLKEDYIPDQIFTLAFWVLFTFLASLALALLFVHTLAFWLPLVTSLTVLIYLSKRSGMHFFEVLEAGILSFLAWFFIFSLSLLIANRSSQVFSLIGINLISLTLFFLVDAHYQKITWYRSGRAGFTGMFVVGLYFLVRSGVALLSPNMLIFMTEYDVFISGIISFTAFLTIFNLAKA